MEFFDIQQSNPDNFLNCLRHFLFSNYYFFFFVFFKILSPRLQWMAHNLQYTSTCNLQTIIVSHVGNSNDDESYSGKVQTEVLLWDNSMASFLKGRCLVITRKVDRYCTLLFLAIYGVLLICQNSCLEYIIYGMKKYRSLLLLHQEESGFLYMVIEM